MMFPSNRVRVLVSTQPVDFRKGHDGLAAIVSSVLRKDQAVNAEPFDPDGMSGGMMAGLFVSNESVCTIFSGIIMMAGNGYYHVIGDRSLLLALDQWDAVV